ncbi:hypothetical protein TNCV_5086291 [Trichonephila clavipes]|uniref:Uncharacterized protein n=1 Tax=Trichonephila clavipes TaxID=2585209 RepID=A0A8X6VCE2_TRICX|nr:hypothetical protein TNCV_5086291 [Trichonephila clavipes]
MVAQRLTQITPPAATPDQLWKRVEAAWSAVPQEHIQSLFESMPRHVTADEQQFENALTVRIACSERKDDAVFAKESSLNETVQVPFERYEMAEFRLLTEPDCLCAHLYRFNLTESPFCGRFSSLRLRVWEEILESSLPNDLRVNDQTFDK